MTKTEKENFISVTARFPAYVGYADHYFSTPASLILRNDGDEDVTLTAKLQTESGLFVFFEKEVYVPYESTVELSLSGIFNPVFLSELAEVTVCTATAKILQGGKEVCTADISLTALPFDWWEGLKGNPEHLAYYVRPHMPACASVLLEAGNRLKVWGSDHSNGYENCDKNSIRSVLAAIFAVIKGKSVERAGTIDAASPLSCMRERILEDRKATSMELAVFACSCLEGAGLHPVLAVGEKDVAVGVWLYETCFLDSVSEDRETVEKYISDGINNLAFFDADDLFTDKKGAYVVAETHFKTKLEKGKFSVFTDIRRCRLGGILPCPTREKGANGYEIYREEDVSGENAPAPLPELGKREAPATGSEKWERRLLDLTGKNALLNFTGKNALHLMSCGADELMLIAAASPLRLAGGKEKADAFGAKAEGQKRELLRLEQEKGLLRVYAPEGETDEAAMRLLRRNRTAEEETGASILYLALGFLSYTTKDGAQRYAPLTLIPATLKKQRGTDACVLHADGKERFINATLLEFLKREYGIDMRGLGGNLKPSEVFSVVRAETAKMKGWKVYEDAYLAALSFERFLMWNDLRRSYEEFGKNKLFSALKDGKYEKSNTAYMEEDVADPAEYFLPLPSDSSQFSAVALSDTGESFVLHGPPGTGKSQTIANIIANALAKGKRVLFVAEKRAALDVVKKRLDGVGIGDFCLELHGDKADKAAALQKLERTLSLPKEEAASRSAKEVQALRSDLSAPMLALHRKRKLGLSVYSAILGYLANRHAPDILDVESSFYDALTEEKLAVYKTVILRAATAARECGSVAHSPFENVNLTVWSAPLRDRVFCASEVVIAESRHLKSFLTLFLEFYRQTMAALSEKKLKGLALLASDLKSGKYDKYFAATDADTFSAFYAANRQLDSRLSYYYKHFKTLVEPDNAEELKTLRAGGDWRLLKSGKNTVKKLRRVAIDPFGDEDVMKYLITLADIDDAEKSVTSFLLSKNFCDRTGHIVYKKRSEFLEDLYRLHESNAALFTDYNAEAFNSMCVRAASGYTLPVLEGYIKAEEAFFTALGSFISVTKTDRSRNDESDLVEFYSMKAAGLIDNIDLLAGWCMYRATAEEMKENGLTFLSEALENGKLGTEDLLAGFEKNIYRNFLESVIPYDKDLSRFTAGSLEDTAEKFSLAYENFTRATKAVIRQTLISRLYDEAYDADRAAFYRISKGNLKSASLRSLFEEIPSLLSAAAPCMLMSPVSVAQYLRPEADLFDLVVFDEASQMSTAEAAGSIARGKAAVIVGDPKQLPPTTFFRGEAVDDAGEEDLESVLDDCLALGLPERHLLWHYRSRHESLIAFSNSMYYQNRLCTFPSPDAMERKVRLIPTDGSYDRGVTKRNAKEAEALTAEVIRRLKDPALSKLSMGVVTFSAAQQEELEKQLARAISEKKLESAAYDREEPLFIKNLENVQGDERDVILFSVCYGPDVTGKVSMNFGPLNQSGGWRRLNVAVSRAREEMLVYASITSSMIDLKKTSSAGVAGLKAFLEYAEKGKTTLSVKADDVKPGKGIGKFIAEELAAYGYRCRVEVGTSGFKVDTAVIDPARPTEFLLGILADGNTAFSVKDKNVLQPQILKRGGWNVLRLNSVSFYNNPKREIKRIKDVLDRLTGADKRAGNWLSKYKKPYKCVKTNSAELITFLTEGEHDMEVFDRLDEIVTAEEPISRAFLKKRCLMSFGIRKSNAKADAYLDTLIGEGAYKRERAAGTDYFYKTPKSLLFSRVRVEEGEKVRKNPEDIAVFDVLSLIKGALEDRVSLYLDELVPLAAEVFGLRQTEKLSSYLETCIAYGETCGLLVRSVSDRITLK